VEFRFGEPTELSVSLRKIAIAQVTVTGQDDECNCLFSPIIMRGTIVPVPNRLKKRVVALVLLALALAGCTRSNNADNEINRLVQQDLPMGTSRSAVVDFLQQHKIQYHDSKEIGYYNGPRTIWGALTQHNGFMAKDAVYTFEFDSGDRLTHYAMKTRNVGP
jgi:hypothetical protein